VNAEQAIIAAAIAAETAIGKTYGLLASGARTAAGTAYSAVQSDVGKHKKWAFCLDVTALAAVVGDKLDVTIQFSLDGIVYYDAIHFTQLAGNGSAGTYWFVGEWTGTAAAPVDLTAPLGSGVGRQSTCWGNYLRAKYVIVDGGAHGQSFTFSVSALGL
jgi:hypothetical protein